MRFRTATMLLALCAAAAGCDAATDDTAPTPAGNRDEPVVQPDPVSYRFRLVGSRPWNDTLYFALGDDIDAGRPYTGTILADDSVFHVEGPPGSPYHLRSEVNPSPAEERMLWMVEARGTLGEGVDEPLRDQVVRVFEAPPRAVVTLLAPAGTGGPDAVTFFHEESGACATAYRDPRHAYFLAVWDAKRGNAYRNVAPPRPWHIEDIAPGTYVIGAVTEGRHWTARRVTIGPDAPLEIDAGEAPTGGGRVICEDAQALLLLDGELPIPAPRITTTLAFRSTWKGVPPGKHRVRYPDGREVDIEVVDGETLKLGR